MSDPFKKLAKATIRDADGNICAMTLAATPQEALQIADDFRERLDAPLIILGFTHELAPGGIPQWRVIHEGVHKLMTEAEVSETMSVMSFD